MRVKLILLLLTVCFIANGRDFYRFSQISRTQGLSSDFVRDITQDSLGFLWFATNNGLCRYDGYDVCVFRETPQQSGGLYNNQLNCVYADKRGELWVGTVNGVLSRYNYFSNRFVHYKISNASELDLGINVNCIFETRLGRLLVGTTDGLYEFDRKTNSAKKIALGSNIMSLSHITAIVENEKADLFIGTMAHGVLCLENGKQESKSLSIVRERNALGERVQINSLFFDKDGQLWVTTNNDGLYVVGNDGLIREHITSFSEGTISGNVPLFDIVQDVNKNIWVCSINGGLFFFDYKDKKLKPQQWLPGMPYTGLMSMSFQSAFLSTDGTLWFGTHGGGVQYCNPSAEIYLHVQASESQLPYRIVSSFFEQNDGTLWVGTDGGGVSLFDSRLHHLKNIGTKQGLPSNAILSMLPRKQSLWMTAWGGGVVEISQTTHKILQTFRYNAFDAYSLPTNEVKWVLPQNDYTWIAGIGKGLCVLKHSNNNILHSGNEGFGLLPLRRAEFASKCIKSSDGSIWVASVSGVHRIKHSFFTYNYKADDSLTPSASYTQALFEDNKGRVWIGTDRGVDFWSATDNKFHRLANKYPQLNVGAVFIEQDTANRYWIGNSNGLFCLDLQNDVMFQYALPIGFNFSQHASLRLRSGQLVLGGNDGFLLVDPRRVASNHHVFSVRITGFSLFYNATNKVLQLDDSVQIDVAQQISLSHNQSVFGFKFAALDYSAEHAAQYWYRLIGFDSTWRLVGKQREVSFTNLNPGQYQFCVRAVVKGSVGNSTQLLISISPPWWQMWWFKILLFLLVVFFIYLLFRWRTYQMQQQKKILEHKVKLRTEALNAANIELLSRKDEIEQQNIQLNNLTSILKHNNAELLNKNEELAALTDELRWQQDTLMNTNKTLANSNATKDTLFSIIGHDLRNAFHSIQGTAQLLHSSYHQMTEEKRLRFVANIDRASTGVFGTFTNLFDWARSQTNRISFVPELVEAAEFITEVVEANRHLADEKQIRIVVDVSPSLIVLADKKMLVTVFRNLFTNAAKFTHTNGMISITARNANPMAEIKVSDTGMGINEETMMRLFEVQATRSTLGTNQETGTGLGLVICREFIERNGGTIQVESQKDKGTSFIVRIPLGNVSAKAPAATKPSEKVQIKATDFKILVAEDDEIIRTNLVQTLEQAGYETLQAINGKQAFDMCHSLLPHLVISDIGMPQADGYHLCQQIKQTPITEQIPVLLLTANTDAAAQLESYRSGADAFLEKPYQVSMLLARVENLLNRRRPNTKPVDIAANAPQSFKDIKPADASLMQRMQELLYANISNPEYSIEVLADDLGMSRTHLYRKIKQLHGIAPSEFQQNLRLQAAAELLKNSSMRISEVAYAVGYTDPHYFSASFVRYFKQSPSEYQKQWRE